MTEFLEYELLSPETADPVVIRITGQRERGFESQKLLDKLQLWD